MSDPMGSVSTGPVGTPARPGPRSQEPDLLDLLRATESGTGPPAGNRREQVAWMAIDS